MPKYDCISIGSATVDLILKSDNFKIVKDSSYKTGAAICEMYGSKVDIEEFYTGSGGGATNTSSALSHFGLKTSCIAGIGMDSFSEVIIDDLKRYNVDISNLLFSKTLPTAFGVILSAKGGGRTALAYRSKASVLTLQHLQDRTLDTSWLYVSNLGADSKNATEVMQMLKNKGLKIMWNPGGAELKDIDISIFENINVFNLNLEEASILASTDMTNIKDTIKFFYNNIKADYSLITLGEKGAICICKSGIYHVYSLKVDVENTIGAGDAFGSGFLYKLISQSSIEDCLNNGVRNSLSVIQKTGAKQGFLTPKSTISNVKVRKLK